MSFPRIRNTVLGDIAELAQLYTQCFNSPPWNDGWSYEAAQQRLGELLAAKQARGAVAFIGVEPVGMALGHKERWVDSYHFNLVEMCVLPALQRQGVGRALLAHLVRQLELEGINKLYLITAPESQATEFYAKQGFRVSNSRVVLTRTLNFRIDN